MHYLHKILVHIPKDLIDARWDREDLQRYANIEASSETEIYEQIAYERRDDYTAGRWDDIYPEIAYLASDDLEWFLNELEEVLEFQKEHMDWYLKGITQMLGTDLKEITEKLWNRSDKYRYESDVDLKLCSYYLSLLGQLLHGDYFYESHFYNTKKRTARLDPSDIDLIKQNPEQWALVMFDYYY